MTRKTITEPAPEPEADETPRTPVDAMEAALRVLRGPNGPLIDPSPHTIRDVAQAVLRGLDGWDLTLISEPMMKQPDPDPET